MNVKNHQIYSDKLDIRVVNLKQINLATEEDMLYNIDRWARLFKSTTWEEIRMVAENNAQMQEATKELYVINQDDLLRQQAQARADYEYYERQKQRKMEKLKQEKAELTEAFEKQRATIAQQADTIEYQINTIEQQTDTIAQQTNTIEQQAAELARLKAELESLKNT